MSIEQKRSKSNLRSKCEIDADAIVETVSIEQKCSKSKVTGSSFTAPATVIAPIPQQPDSHSCGLLMCYHLKTIYCNVVEILQKSDVNNLTEFLQVLFPDDKTSMETVSKLRGEALSLCKKACTYAWA